MKRVVSGIWILVLLVSLFSGCAKKTAYEGAYIGVELNRDGVLVPEGSWNRAKDEPLLLTWFVCDEAFTKEFDPVSNMGFNRIYGDTGVKIQFIHGNEEKLNQFISTDSLPGIISMPAALTQRVALEDAGRLAALEPLFLKYADDVNVPRSMLDWYRNADGNTYCLVNYYYGDERTGSDFGGMYVSQNRNFVREDILLGIGKPLEDIQTKDGMLAALRAVQAGGCTDLDGNPVIPWGPLNINMLAEQFGYAPENADGSYNPIYTDEAYLEAVLFANQLCREGLMKDTSLTDDIYAHFANVSAGRYFAGVDANNFYANARRKLYAAEQETGGAETDGLILFADRMDGQNDKKTYYAGTGSAGYMATMIHASAENKDRIVQLFSYLTTEVATLDVNYGPGCYIITDDGRVERTQEAYDLQTADASAFNAKYYSDMKFFVDYTIIQKYWPKVEGNRLERDTLLAEMESSEILYDDKCFTGLDPLSNTDLAATQTVLESYWAQSVARMVLASDEDACRALYKEACAYLAQNGFAELCDYRNERLQANKERMGIRYAYPGNR